VILQCDRTGRFDIESAALLAAARAGVPVPAILGSGYSAAVGASCLVTEYVQGETLPTTILRDRRFDAVRPQLAAQCGEILAAIHRIGPAEVPGLRQLGDPVEALRRRLDADSERVPAFEFAMRWLDANRPETVADAVVHGDFRLGNLLVGTDGIEAVLDWEFVHRGDPISDLGYVCTRAWRFGGARPVGGFGEYRDLIDAYERARGELVDDDAVRWWQVWSTVSWGAGCLFQGRRRTSEGERSLELAAIGRRVYEQAYDTLLLLADRLECRR
jgi:aminoglycoside phosphotransferase (APT) family kinase protein